MRIILVGIVVYWGAMVYGMNNQNNEPVPTPKPSHRPHKPPQKQSDQKKLSRRTQRNLLEEFNQQAKAQEMSFPAISNNDKSTVKKDE